jgi:hypothetical protein
LQLKAQEVQIKRDKLMVDAGAKENQQQIEMERIAAQERIAGMQVGAKAEADKLRTSAQQEAEGLRIGTDISKHKSQLFAAGLRDAHNIAQQERKPTKGDK